MKIKVPSLYVSASLLATLRLVRTPVRSLMLPATIPHPLTSPTHKQLHACVPFLTQPTARHTTHPRPRRRHYRRLRWYRRVLVIATVFVHLTFVAVLTLYGW